MDIIVRGIRAGLPLGDCMREIAASAEEPIRSEFRLVTESQAMGVTLSDALERLAERVPVAESLVLRHGDHHSDQGRRQPFQKPSATCRASCASARR